MLGKLTEQIQGLGYRFTEGKPLLSVPSPEGGFIEIRELTVERTTGGQVLVLKHDGSPTMFPGRMVFRQGVLDASLMDGVKTTCGAIYRDYYGLDDNSYSMLLYNYSGRTKAFLDAEKARIGLIDYKEGMPEQFFALERYTIEQGIGEVEVGQYADGRFVVQSARPLFEEDYVLRMHFKRFPTREEVEIAVTIRKVERDFKLGRHREIFHCGDCGELRHWLDIAGPIEQKLGMRLMRKCGCKA